MNKIRIISHILDPLKNTKKHGKIEFGIEWKYNKRDRFASSDLSRKLMTIHKWIITLGFIKPIIEISILYTQKHQKL